MIIDIKELDIEEKIKAEDFGFYVDDFTEKYTGIPGTVYVCVDLLYEDNLGPRLRIYPITTQNPIHINPYATLPVFFNEIGDITCDIDVVNTENITKFISENLTTLLSYWKHDGMGDSISLRNDIKLLGNLNEN